MKVVILAGGRGSRLGADVPKPMVEIGRIPMLSHIMGIYKKYGYNDFIVATGYCGEYIRDYYKKDPCVTCIDTGLDSLTGERVRECALRIEEEEFMLTYGDGVSDIDINKLIKSYHKKVTVTAVHPPARFGQLKIRGNKVSQFNEKSSNQEDWVNGGFFVVSSEFASKASGKSWEYDTLSCLAEEEYLYAYKHTGFWQCMDTQRDVDYLNQLWKEGAPWL